MKTCSRLRFGEKRERWKFRAGLFGVFAIFQLDDAEIRDAGGRSSGASTVRFTAARPDKSEGAELEKMTLTG